VTDYRLLITDYTFGVRMTSKQSANLCPLHVRSGYSLLRGPSALERVVGRAAALGHTRLALTDVNNLCGATLFWKQATRAGLTPILGAELVEGDAALVALVDGEQGYEHLCQVITKVQGKTVERGPWSVGRNDEEKNNEERNGEELHENVSSSPLRSSLLRPTPYAPRSTFFRDLAELSSGMQIIVEQASLAGELLSAGVEAGRIWLGIDPATQTHSQLRALEQCARERGLAPVLSGKALMAAAEDYSAARLLAAIRTGGTMDNVAAAELPHSRAVLRSPAELEKGTFYFSPASPYPDRNLPGKVECPLFQAARNNQKLSEMCGDFKLLPRRPVFPDYQCPEGLDALAHLRQLCEEGLWRRYGSDVPEAAAPRLARELDLIARKGFCEYFLVVWDIVQYARRRGAPVAGRGSGGSSLAAYLLGITNVCPIAFEIPFERFLNEYREDFPDLDVDFCWRIRDDVIAYAFRRWGQDRVAMVSMHTTFQHRSAWRETAKAMGMSNEQITEGTEGRRARSEGRNSEEKNNEERNGEEQPPGCGDISSSSFRPSPFAPRPSSVSSLASSILGLPHVLSVHPGGIVIGRKAIDHYVPVQRAAKGVMISQMDKNGLEDMKLVKLDLLGNRNLSTIRCATDLIRRRHGVSVDVETLPPDAATIEMLQRADTVGCNQIESPAMRHLLRMMRPRDVRDVMKVLALIRPGAASIGMKEVFIRRHRGIERAEDGVPCPSLRGHVPLPTEEEKERHARADLGMAPDVAPDVAPDETPTSQVARILRDTCGVMVYEDDVMLVAAALMGCGLDQADRFRKAVQKCQDDAERLDLSRRFLSACTARGVDAEFAKSMWVQMAKYNAYSFCRAHAASYAVLAYAGAYLKAHWPLEFWCSALNNNQSMYPTRCYVEQAKRGGVRFAPPDANRSQEEFTIEENCKLQIADCRLNGKSQTEPIPSFNLQSAICNLQSSASVIRVGLNRISGLGPAHIQSLLRARARGPFAGLSDCLARTDLGREQARAMILCGAFDFTARPRPALMLELELFLSTRMGRIWQGQSLLAIGANMPVVPGDYEPLQKYMQERQILGLCTGRHIMELYRESLAEFDGTYRSYGSYMSCRNTACVPAGAEPVPAERNPHTLLDSRALAGAVGKRVRIAGVLEAQRSALTVRGGTMLFLTLDDEFGLFEVTVFPDQARTCQIGGYGPYLITGTVEDQYGAVTIRAQSVEMV
jgi:DNA-directed DNA polymerase III PolC